MKFFGREQEILELEGHLNINWRAPAPANSYFLPVLVIIPTLDQIALDYIACAVQVNIISWFISLLP